MARQLTFIERERVSQMHAADYTQADIARELRRHPSTICRELKRNSDGNEYTAVQAENRCRQRRRERPLERKMERRETADFVRQHLARFWSPDQIAGRLRTDYPKQPKRHISPQTIYTWMDGLPNKEERQRFRSFLRRAGCKRRWKNAARGGEDDGG